MGLNQDSPLELMSWLKRKNLTPCQRRGEGSALWKCRELGAASAEAGLPDVVYLLLKHVNVNVQVEKKIQAETEEVFSSLSAFLACLSFTHASFLPNPIF